MPLKIAIKALKVIFFKQLNIYRFWKTCLGEILYCVHLELAFVTDRC